MDVSRARHTPGLALMALLLSGLLGCGSDPQPPVDPSKLDNAGKIACDDFAQGYRAAATPDTRAALARAVNEWAAKSTTGGLAERGAALARSAGKDSWQASADAFAQVCLDAGWKSG